MTMPCSCSPPSPELFTADEIVAAEALLSLHCPVVFFPHWLKKRKRSVPHDDEDEELAKGARLSPRSPLSFDPSGGDDTPRPLTLIPPPPPAPPLPPRRKRKAPDNNSYDERCNKLAKGSEQSIAALSAPKLNLEQSVPGAKSRCQFLKEEDTWLKHLQFQRSMAWIHQQQQLRDLFPLGLSHTVGHHHHHHHHQNTWPMSCLNWKQPATAALRQQRAAEYALARKRRSERRRTKICPSPSLN